jgi:poly(A) polymerase
MERMLDGYPHHEIDQSLVEACYQRPLIQGPQGLIVIGDVINQLLGAGMRVFVTGGAPRDWLCGGVVKDIDVVVDKTIQQVHAVLEKAFPGVEAILIHSEDFGIIRWGSELGSVDISILRGAESIHGKPISQTRFEPSGSLYADGRMCDFSINAFYYDCQRRQLLEVLEGSLEDLRQRRLRLISHPRKLAVDYRTSMRIAQFVSRGYTPDESIRAHLERHGDRDVLGMEPMLASWVGEHVPPEPRVRELFHACLLPYLKDPRSRELLARAVEIGARGTVPWSPPGPGGQQTQPSRRAP